MERHRLLGLKILAFLVFNQSQKHPLHDQSSVWWMANNSITVLFYSTISSFFLLQISTYVDKTSHNRFSVSSRNAHTSSFISVKYLNLTGTWGRVRGEWPCRRNVSVGFHTTADTQKREDHVAANAQHRGGAPEKLLSGRRRVFVRSDHRNGAELDPEPAVLDLVDAVKHHSCTKWNLCPVDDYNQKGIWLNLLVKTKLLNILKNIL